MIKSNILKIGKQIYLFKEQALESLCNQNYGTAKAYYHYQLKRKDRRFKKPPILIYQMGKVGSSSVTKSLRGAQLQRPIYHIHFLLPELVDKYEQKRKHFLNTDKGGDLKHIWQYQYLNERLKEPFGDQKWKVITLVRDPVARNLSDFFEHIEVVSSEAKRWVIQSFEYDFEITIVNNNLNELCQIFFEKFDHDTPLLYFDQEFKGVLGVDLFTTDFPTAKGYHIHRESQFEVLVIRLEDLDRCFTEALKAFLAIDDLNLINTNITDQKDSANLYQSFKDVIRLPEAYLDKMYTAKFSQHFYSPEEIEQFRAKWSDEGVI